MLVVDDNQDAAATLGSLLELGGHQVRIANTGQQAIEAVVETMPRLVFLDIGLPDMGGHEVAQALRALPPGPRKLKLVALTGWGAENDRRRSMQAGFDLHLTKPLDPVVLDQILEQLLNEDAQ